MATFTVIISYIWVKDDDTVNTSPTRESFIQGESSFPSELSLHYRMNLIANGQNDIE